MVIPSQTGCAGHALTQVRATSLSPVTEMNMIHSLKPAIHAIALSVSLLIVPSASAKSAATRPATSAPSSSTTQPAKPQAAPGKKELKAQKRERQQASMLQKVQRRGEAGAAIAAPTSAPI